MASDDKIDIEVHVHYATAKAILVSDDGVREGAVWIAKSFVSGGYDGPTDVNTMIEIPEWLAIREGLA